MIDMTCQGCEQRRQWLRKQSERAKERMRLCLQRLADDYLPADQVEQTEEQPAQAAIRKLDQILAKQNIPRQERRKLFQAIKADTRNAVVPSTPNRLRRKYFRR